MLHMVESILEEKQLRLALWMNHGCPKQALYGDDGEMQCNAVSCRIDFKREPLARLCLTLMALGCLHVGPLKKASEHSAATGDAR